MSIFPANDMIVDVARAADPTKRDLATRRLAALSQGADFGPMSAELRQGRLQTQGVRTLQTAAQQRTPSAADPIRKFEAFILQSFIEQMLPKDTENVYGHGLAGDIWRSLMAEHMATRITEAGGIGIGKTLNSANAAKFHVQAQSS